MNDLGRWQPLPLPHLVELFVGVFLAVVAVLALVQVVYYLRRYLRR